MRGRESKGPPSTDLLVCFPTRAHLTLMPKPICSPARPSDPNKRHHNHNHNHNHHHHHHHHLRKLSSRGGGGGGGGGPASPLLWSKTKPMGPNISEPTSPKVTCAGQIKVRPKASCKNWQSVMEEIEKLHNDRKQKKRSSNWVEAFGFKKDTMQFLTCLRRIRFDFRCFGSFPTSELSSEDEDDNEAEEEDREKKVAGVEKTDEQKNSATVFSKWFMVLQQEKNITCNKEERKQSEEYSDKQEEPTVAPCGPPPNALLLMRCRSAPAKSWLEEREDDEDEEIENEEEEEEKKEKLEVKEEKRSRSLAVVMKSDSDFYNLSSDIAKETWVVGGLRDAISRSRSWKR